MNLSDIPDLLDMIDEVQESLDIESEFTLGQIRHFILIGLGSIDNLHVFNK